MSFKNLLLRIVFTFVTLFLSTSVSDALSWRMYLPGYKVVDIAFEGDVVWCAAGRDGIIRFDRNSETSEIYKAENVPVDSYYSAVAVDHNGVKWFGTHTCIISFDDTEWKVYSTETMLTQTFGLGRERVYVHDITVDRNNVKWFAVANGTGRFDDVTWERTTRDSANRVTIDRNGKIWFVAESLIQTYDMHEWVYIVVDDGRDDTSVAVDDNGIAWVTTDSGLKCFDGESWTDIDIDAWPLADNFRSIVIDENNTKWLGSANGLGSYDDWGFSWQVRDNYDRRFEPSIHDMIFDVNGDLWAAADGTLYYDSHRLFGLIRYYRIPTGVDMHKPDERGLLLDNASPNPFNAFTAMTYYLPHDGTVEFSIFDITGRKVRDLVSGFSQAGIHRVIWDGADNTGAPVSSGLYLCRVSMRGTSVCRKIVFLK